MSMDASFRFDNTYARLPAAFFARTNPVRVAAPSLIQVNGPLAEALGLDAEYHASAAGVEVLAGNRIAVGSEPLAQAYAGHQFGNFVPQLGDGRANLLGELLAADGTRYDLQLKGAGPTPFSRRGDGRAALGPVLREYLVSEAMHAMGVPSTRALAAVLTGQAVLRESAQPGAILTRVARSHLRVGTFQFFWARAEVDSLRTLADYALARHYPEALAAEKPYLAFLQGVIARQALLVAQWMCLGFIHGVMNTDNTSISGETIDFGPCAFLEAYEPDKVFSSIDQQGRYAYANQPNALHWNLTRLAESLLPLLNEEQGSAEGGMAAAVDALNGFGAQYEAARLAGFRRKLGLLEVRESDGALVEELLQLMHAGRADFTLTFRRLAGAADSETRELLGDGAAFEDWAARWRARQGEETACAEQREELMRGASPTFIPRNHLVQAVIEAAELRQDFAPFRELLAVVTRPYAEADSAPARYTAPAEQHEQVFATFCGT